MHANQFLVAVAVIVLAAVVPTDIFYYYCEPAFHS